MARLPFLLGTPPFLQNLGVSDLGLLRLIIRLFGGGRNPAGHRPAANHRKGTTFQPHLNPFRPPGSKSAHARVHVRAPSPVLKVVPAPKVDLVLAGRCWVVDGDTIWIGETSIRLAGIDAPELDHPWGVNAKVHLIKLCKGQTIRAVFHGEQSHLREVATCYLPDGRDLSAEMVRAGMAVDWPKYSGGKYRPLETAHARQLLWRCVARQQGRMPPGTKRA